MSDRRIREQHRRKFQELINPENRSKHFRSDTPSSRGGNNIPSSSRGEGNNIPSSRGEGNNIPSSRGGGNNIPSSKSGGNDIPSNRSEGNNNTPISNNNTSAAEATGRMVPDRPPTGHQPGTLLVVDWFGSHQSGWSICTRFPPKSDTNRVPY